jgi:Zn-dependent peptidase ImmA (M78 family)/DNA-binding XRE family transcriptional regulator
MNAPLEQISPKEVGERLRLARDAADLTQAKAADALEMARTTLVAIEQGQRLVRMDELRNLARLYGTSVNGLLRVEAIHVDLAPRFRKLVGVGDDPARAASQLLTDLAKAEVELENLLGVRRTRNYPLERPIMPGNVVVQAEQDALEVRQRLGLGLAPITDMITLLELELGVRVYVRHLHHRISGLFAYDEKLGACILLNAGHPSERRGLTAAHELGHLVSTRREADVLDEDTPERTPEERYCNAFARNFLMPARAVMQKFKEMTAGALRLTRRHVIVLAHAFGVSREALVRRLEELKLTKSGTWDWFEDNGGIADAQVRQVLGDLVRTDAHKADAARPTTLRLNMLAAEAWRQELLSEGQLVRLLKLDRVELRHLFDAAEMEGSAADEAPGLPL